jgi:hypothetical protein
LVGESCVLRRGVVFGKGKRNRLRIGWEKGLL